MPAGQVEDPYWTLLKLALRAAASGHGAAPGAPDVHDDGYAFRDVFGNRLPSWNICALSAALASRKLASVTSDLVAWLCCVSTSEYVARPIISIITIANIAATRAEPRWLSTC